MNKNFRSYAWRAASVSFSVLMVLAMCFALLPQDASAAAATTGASCARMYTVQSGDKTAHVAHTFGVAWRDIASANGLSEPYILKAGTRLCIPASTSTTTNTTGTTGSTSTLPNTGTTTTVTGTTTTTVTTSTNANCASTYTVKENDATSKIAKKYSLKWKVIATANKLTAPYRLTTGQRLCIPVKTTSTSTTTTAAPVGVGSGNATPTNFSFSATVVGDRVVVRTTNFKADTALRVKIRDAATGGSWTVLGPIKAANGDTNLSNSFSLPNSLSSTARLRVCLKDQFSNSLYCITVPHTSA